MSEYVHPSKEQVRAYLEERIKQHTPPPSQKEIRRQLGFELIIAQREKTHS